MTDPNRIKQIMKKMKRMMIALAGLMTLNIACQREDLLPQDVTPEGYLTIEFVAQVPDMGQVQTKAVDPDGAGVQQMTVFCFDENSLFITTVTASLEPDSGNPSLSGRMKITVPDHTVTLQLVGNQNLTYFREDLYRGMSEVDVMAALEASAGRMIYWARSTVDALKSHDSQANALRLLRNQAKITLNVDTSRTDFVESGWVVVGSNAFGTVAPYSTEHGGFVAPSLDDPFVTLPDNRAKLGDFLDVRTNDEDYIFETENSVSDPIDFIVKGRHGEGEELYYRISLIDENGDNVMILRNHHYTVNIAGDLYYGQKTFAEALEAPATNNVWVSISDNISAVRDSDYELAVDFTSVVIGESEFQYPNTYHLHYTLTSLNGGTPVMPSVTWMDGNNVALATFSHTMTPEGRGTITVTLNQMGQEQKREGTIFIKAGRLSRKIKLITVKEQNFEPAWITTNVFGVGTGENVTMMFTVSDDCPRELFPMEVLISVNALDIRSESGMHLPVKRAGDEGYGEDNGIGYKYVLNVTGAGKQRIYLETILEQNTGSTIDVTIEAKHFASLTKTATFRSDVDQWILLHNLRSYSASQPADEVIYYYLVPQKVNAVVEFPTHLGKDIVWNDDHTVADYTPVTPGADDEFLIYSRHLDHNEAAPDLDFTFYKVNEALWSTGGRVYGFKRNMDGTQGQGAIYQMITNTPRSAEVVRIASNPYGAESVTGAGTCTGAQYRSAVFELANYHPFHFSALVNGEGTIVAGEQEEITDNIMLSYLPDQIVNIDFDITSFVSSIRGNDGNVLDISEQTSVDPFGTAFDIYIDAPMLKIDPADELYRNGKITAHPEIEGRYIYHVDASRDSERNYGTLVAANDALTTENQSGERKRLTFKTKDIVSAGEITISSDESKVVFYRKTFKIQNSSMTGTIRYRTASGVVDVPAGSFVPFEVFPTYNRIGTVTISDAGQFELRLRSEYEYDWNTDDVTFQFIDADGNKYEKTYDSLNSLYSSISGSIILEPVA